MSLVPKTPQASRLNGSSPENGAVSRIPAYQNGIENPGLANHSADAAPSFDFWGLLRRRIHMIVLLCIVGALLGYLNYVKSPKVYSSATRLLITTQAPPSIVNGNVQLNHRNSLPNHSNLLQSELVLGSAIEFGKLDKLKTFSATGNTVGKLKSMIQVVPEVGDTLQVICTGAHPEDLPTILNQIVEAYRRAVVDDSQSASEQAVSLIEALAREMGDEKDDLEADRLNLRSQLDVTSTLENGMIRNPYTSQLQELRDSKDKHYRALSDLKLRRQQLIEAATVDEETKELDPLKIKVAALEARDFLNLSRIDLPADVKPIDVKPIAIDEETNRMQEWQTLQRRVWEIDSAISELRASLVSRTQIVGTGHGSVTSLKTQIAYRQKEMEKLQSEMDQLQTAISEDRNTVDDTDEKLSKLESEQRKDWIRMYHLALVKQEKTTAAKIKLLDDSIALVGEKASSIGEKIFKYNVIQKAIDKKERAVDVILDRLKEINVLADNYTMTKIRTLQEPKRGGQVAPSFSKSLMFATMLAGLLGLGLAFLVDQGDMSFRSPNEILSHLNLQVVGKIPRIRTRRIAASKGVAELISAHKPAASESEAFRAIRTNLFFRANNEDIKTILLTSPSPGDGKSTTAANLAISIAQAGKRVVLVDADFRRPRIARYFGEELEVGFIDVLAGEMTLDEVIKPTELQDGLHIVTAGGYPKNPGELVTSPQFRETLEALRESFDFVIIDSPPILAVSDSISIASHVDGIYLVSRIRKGVKLTTRRAKESLDNVHAAVLGLIVNDVDRNPHYHEYGYQYSNYAYYGSGSYRNYYDQDHGSNKNGKLETRAKIET